MVEILFSKSISAKKFYARSKGKIFDSYKEGKEYFDEVAENFKEGHVYIGQGVDFDGLDDNRYITGAENLIASAYIKDNDMFGHTGILGTTRRGKTRLMMAIVRQLIWKGDQDIFLSEPKGSIGQEVLAWIIEFLEEVDSLESFKYISPVFPSYSLQFNPLFGLDDEEIASAIAGSIQADEKFFSDIGYEVTMSIVQALRFLEMLWEEDVIKEKINQEYRYIFGSKMTVDNINAISNPDLASETINPVLYDSIEELEPPLRSLLTVSDLAKYSSKKGLQILVEKVEAVSQEAIVNLYSNRYPFDEKQEKKHVNEAVKLKANALKALTSQIDKPNDYFSKIASSYKLVLDKMSSGKLGELLCSTRINPIYDLLRNSDKPSVFVLQPAPLVFKEASISLMRILTSMFCTWYGKVGATGRRFKRDLVYVVDEAGAVLTEEVLDMLNKGGGLKMKLIFATQSFGDYVAALGPEKATVALDNINIKMYMAVNDNESKQKISELFGGSKRAQNSFGNSGVDARGQVSYQQEEYVQSAQVSDLPVQFFLYQNANLKMMVKAPFLMDPDSVLEMPYLDMEREIDAAYNDVIEEVRKWEKNLY